MTERHAITRHRHELKRRRLAVVEKYRLTPRMIRVVVAGDDLEGFVSLGHDDHVKLFFPRNGVIAEPTMGPNGPVYADGVEPPSMRDFTPRSYDPDRKRLTLDFALHDAGPATEWAETAQIGAPLVVGGPRGSFVVADDFDWYLLAGDETAIPAIARRLEVLRPEARALVVMTVAGPEEELTLTSAADLTVRWVHRGADRAADPAPLVEALRTLDLPDGDGYAWVAAESGVAKAARGHLVGERGLNPAWVKAAGYWRTGGIAVHDVHAD